MKKYFPTMKGPSYKKALEIVVKLHAWRSAKKAREKEKKKVESAKETIGLGMIAIPFDSS